MNNSNPQEYQYEILHGYSWRFVIYDNDGNQEAMYSGYYDWDDAERAAVEWINDKQEEEQQALADRLLIDYTAHPRSYQAVRVA